jgi:alkylation response protein AidB-like acyl-CoA dehydrogenase
MSSPLILSEDQELIRETARELVRVKSPVKEMRRLRDSRDADGFSRALWKEAVELGWAGIPFGEELGGAGLGYAELGIVLEELGRTLAPTPMLSTVVLAGSAIQLAGSAAQKEKLLRGICDGSRILALAHQETPRFAPYRTATRAEKTAGGFRITGRKIFVLDGHVADTLVVVARVSGAEEDRAGLGLFLVSATQKGVAIARTTVIDGRNAAQVELGGVEIGADAALGTPGAAADVLDAVFDRGAAALASEMMGGIQEAFDRTLAYLKARDQFGVKIGSFQALKHRAADWFCEVELTRAIVLEALRAIDSRAKEAPRLVSAAKARASDTFMLSGEEGVQMHGGIGMTDEEDIGLFLKRARAAEQTLGDGGYHRDRFAKLAGY